MKLLKQNLLYAHGARPEYARDVIPHGDQWYIPTRVLPLVRPRRDIIILPRTIQTIDFSRFIRKVLGILEDQIAWTTGRHFTLDADIVDDMLPAILPFAWKLRKEYCVVPYSVLPEMVEWTSRTGLPVFADDMNFVRNYGHKGILHEGSSGGCLIPGIPTARGYFCNTYADLTRALSCLACPSLIKPIYGSAGEGITDATEETIRGYHFRLGPVVVEEKLIPDTFSLQNDEKTMDLSYSTQFNGTEILGRPTVQLLEGTEWVGNIMSSSFTPSGKQVTREVIDATRRAVVWLSQRGFRGPGGFDFLSVAGHAVMVDVNVGRFTGAHIPKIFKHLYAPKSPVMLNWKVKPCAGTSVFDVWEKLERKHITFTPGKTAGVFPLCYLPGIWAMFVVFGETDEQVLSLKHECGECFPKDDRPGVWQSGGGMMPNIFREQR